jgi:hypothetical protein
METGIATHASNVWWTIYVLDQSLSAGLGCPPTIPLNSITTSLPDVQSDSISTKALALRSRLSQINSVIYSSMFSLVARLELHTYVTLTDSTYSTQLSTASTII